jgi:aminoglycoside phosphotransferase
MVSIETLKSYLQTKFNTTEFILEPIVGLGEVNQLFKTEIDGKTYILRVNIESEFETFVKECWCYEQAHKQGIPVPKVIELITRAGVSIMLMEYLKGENCSTMQSKDKHTQVYMHLGAYVKKLSLILPSEDIGDLKSVAHASSWFYTDYLGYELKKTASVDDYLELSAMQRNLLMNAIKLLSNTKFSFVLCHGDISLKNCMYVHQTQLLYLIDFGSAETHIKDYYEIMLKWLNVIYKQKLSESDFWQFATGMLSKDAKSWFDDNLDLIKALALVYTLDKYRYAHDKAPEWLSDYQSRFYSVLALIA